MRLLLTLTFAAAASVTATATAQQYGWIMEVDNPTLGPVGSGLPQETQITLFATFDSAVHYAMAGGEFDLLASEPGSTPGNWHSNEVLPPLDFGAALAGVLTETGVTDAFPAQLHYPPFEFFGDPVNPAPAWRITYTATDFTARSINLETVTSRFFAHDELGGTHEIPLASVMEGAALITIVPGCRADIDGDGELTIFDFLAFNNLFSQGDPRADFDGDGELTIFDFLAFNNEFSAGC